VKGFWLFCLGCDPLCCDTVLSCRYLYLLHISAFEPSSRMHIQCWLHCSPLTSASVYSGYILCCQFGTLWCNAIMYVFVRMFNLTSEFQHIVTWRLNAGNVQSEKHRKRHQLLDNGSLTQVSAATDRGTVGNADLYSVRPEVIKGGQVLYCM
jgi:hypothetical protein